MLKKKNNKKKHVVILGAGLAGLAAGYELRKSYKVTVIEEMDDVGGLARTIEKDGFRFDTGPHRWYTKNDMVNKWMLDLMAGEVIQVPRLTRIYFDKKFFFYPIRFKNVLFGMGIIKAVHAVLDYLLARMHHRMNPKKAVTLEDGYIEKFGNTLYKMFFKRYSEKLWGRSCKLVSSDWIGQRTRGFNIVTIIKDALFNSRNVVSFVDEFSYPERGIGRISEKLAMKVRKYKGEIHLNTTVIKIHHQNNKITAVTVTSNGKSRDIRGDIFISSIALSDAVFSITPKAPKEMISLAQKLTYRDQVEVALFIKGEHITPDTWIYVHPENISFMRLMEMSNWSTKLSPKGTTTLVFEISCNIGDEMWEKSDKDLISMVTDEFIDEFNLITRDDIIDGYVHRIPKEYPVYHLGYREDVDRLKTYIREFTNLQIVGRNGTFRYNNMDHSIEMGLFAAWNILEGKNKYDVDSVNIEREYLEEKDLEKATKPNAKEKA